MTVSISEKPWSDYASADYDVKQWCDACLIHQHDGPATSKGQCKLPVRTPSGTLSRAGVHAAAAALAGARGGVNATPAETAKAIRAIGSLYKQLDEKPPASMQHAETPTRTVQDILNAMTPVQTDLMHIIVGAAIEDVDISGEADVVQKYNALSPEQKNVIDFIVGGLLAEDSVLNHSDEVSEFLAHVGVKGMHWGVRKDTSGGGQPARLSQRVLNKDPGFKALRVQAKANVKAGTASLGNAHIAAVKSTGHRVANAFLGDKTYWKRAGIITGVGAAGVGASLLLPAALPAGVLAAIGAHTLGTSTAAAGSTALTNVGINASVIGASIANQFNTVSNLGRAIRGNARIDKSHAALGKRIYAHQTLGDKRVRKVLNQSGSISKKHLQQSDEVGEFLAHFGIKGMHWGVRRSDGPDGTVSSNPASAAPHKVASDDAVRAAMTSKAIQKRGTHVVSNAELQHLISRMNLEKQFADFDKSKAAKLDRSFNKILKYGGTFNKAIAFANSPAGRLLSQSLRVSKTGGKHAGLAKTLIPSSTLPKGKKKKNK